MKKTILIIVCGMSCGFMLSLATAQVTVNKEVTMNAANDVNAEVNAMGVTTSMNGNNSTNSGVPISSTSASHESRSVTGSN